MNVSAPESSDRTADDDQDLRWVRQDTLTTLLVVIGAATWLLITTYVIHAADFWPGWGTLTALGCLILISFFGRDRHERVAVWLFTGGLFATVATFYLTPGEKLLAPFLFVIPVLVAGTLRGNVATLAIALLSTVTILLGAPIARVTIQPDVALGSLALIWLSVLVAWATTRDLYTALHWAWANSDSASRNLEEARSYQAQLAAALRQLEEANYRLERANHALAWARAEAEESKRLKAQFAAHVSHELRTPINLIVGFTELMLHSPDAYGGQRLPAAYVSDLAAVYRNSRHLQGLIDDILDLSQLDEGEMPIVREPTDIGGVVHEAVATARPLLTRKGLSIAVELASDLPMVNIDRLRIRQVLLNLLNNAARFTDSGGVTVRAIHDPDQITIEVRDTGVGVKPSDVGSLFRPFHQLERSPTRGRGGTGLGLAISKRFVELHGGRIWVESDGVPGHGSLFAFSLPLGQETVPIDEENRDLLGRSWREHAPAPAPTVVAVHADPSLIRLLRRHLCGYEVIAASSPTHAVELASRLLAQAILVDMPGPERLGTWLQEWTDLAHQHGVRVVACPLPGNDQRARALGLVDFLVKPVSRSTLLSSIEKVAPTARDVLVVDDDRHMVGLLCRILQSADRTYRTRRAYSGHQALRLLKQRRPDLLLLDFRMPTIDGRSLIEHLRDDPELGQVPIIAVTGQVALESLAPRAARGLVLIDNELVSVSASLRSIQTVLDSLPPVEAPSPGNGRERQRVSAPSAAF